MKLSAKGYLKIGNSIAAWVEDGVIKVTFDPDKIEFKSDDFTGAVILTVEEANHINNVINQLFLSTNKANIHLTQEQANALIEFQYQVEGCE